MQSICIIRLSAIGDVCNAVAAVQAIQSSYSESQITWVVGRVEAELLRYLPGIRLVVFDKKRGWRAYRDLRRQLPETFDVLLSMQRSFRANLVTLCLKAKRKIGLPRQQAKEGHRWVVHEFAPDPLGPHVVDSFMAQARALGAEAEPRWLLPYGPDDDTRIDALLNPNRVKAHTETAEKQPLLVVSPSASKAERNWLPERYAEVMCHAAQAGFTLVLSGGPSKAEKQMAEAIIQAFNTLKPADAAIPVINLVGKTALTALLALFKRATLVITPDSGPAHMANSQGTMVLGLYAHSNPERTGPYHWRDQVVSVYQNAILDEYRQEAQHLPWGTRAHGKDLMARIAVDRVIAQFDAMTYPVLSAPVSTQVATPVAMPVAMPAATPAAATSTVSPTLPKRALFLDRDGVINQDLGFVHSRDEFHYLEGIFDLCRRFHQAGYALIVVTNQSGIGRGLYSEADFLALSDWMKDRFIVEGCPLTAVYYCPHHPREAEPPYRQDCHCRKPAPGMLLQAMQEHHITREGSLMIGNQATDIAAAEAAGIRGVLVETDQGGYTEIQPEPTTPIH